MDITSGGVTRIITSLEKKGFIKREISPIDRREIIVNLTPDGEKLANDVRKASIEIHEEIIQSYNFENLECILDGIDDLVSALKLWLNKRENG